MANYKCTCPEDWQGMDHANQCKARAREPIFLSGAIADAYEKGFRVDPETGVITAHQEH